MPPQYVRLYVKRNKNGATDTEAICEAVTRPQMRFVPVKSAEQQSVLMLHRAREPMICQHTMLVNAMRVIAARPTITVLSWLGTQFRIDAGQMASDVALLRATGIPEP